MSEIKKGLLIGTTNTIKVYGDDISSNINLNLGSGSIDHPIQFSHFTTSDGEQKAVTIKNGLFGIDVSNNDPRAKLHIGKEYFGKNTILGNSNPASIINTHTCQTKTDDHNYYKIAQLTAQDTTCYGGLNIKGTIIGKGGFGESSAEFTDNFMRFDITIMISDANTSTVEPTMYMIGTVNGSAMNTDPNSNNEYDLLNTYTPPASLENDIIVSNISDSVYPKAVILCLHKESVCNIEITSTAFNNNSDINCFYIEYDGIRHPTIAPSAYSEWKGGNILQLSDPAKNDIIYNTPNGVGIGTNVPKSNLDVSGCVAIGSTYSGTDAAPTDGLLVEGNVGIGTNAPEGLLHISSAQDAILKITGDNTDGDGDGTKHPYLIFQQDGSYNEGGIFLGNGDSTEVEQTSATPNESDVSANDLIISASTNSGGNIHFKTDNTSSIGAVDISNLIYAPTRMTILANGNVGIGTTDPKTTLDVSGTDALRIPVGDTSERPTSSNLLPGQIRYNSENSQFEGYTNYSQVDGEGNVTYTKYNWETLNGVSNYIGNTKIISSYPDADSTNNDLIFYTSLTDYISGPLYANVADNLLTSAADYPNGLVGVVNDVYNTPVSPSSSGNGIDAVLSITADNNNGGEITSVSVSVPGTGYQVGDTLTVSKTYIPGRVADLIFILTANNINATANANGPAFERMRIDPTGNVGIGTDSPSKKLEVSNDALISTLTVGRGKYEFAENTAFGYQALESVGGMNHLTKYNTAIGYQALKSLVGNNILSSGLAPAEHNTAIGYKALLSSNSSVSGATYNTAVGSQALQTNVVGKKNTAIGKGSLYTNKSSYNTAVGMDSLSANDSGELNTAIGLSSLVNNINGQQNTAIGYLAGHYSTGDGSTTGNKNTFLGTSTHVIYDSTTQIEVNYSTAVGYNAEVTKNNQIVLGGDAGSSSYPEVYIPGNVGIGTTSPQSKLDVEGGVRIGSTYSGNTTITTDPANGMIVEGNVGIGLTNPAVPLEVYGGSIGGSGGAKDALTLRVSRGSGNGSDANDSGRGARLKFSHTGSGIASTSETRWVSIESVSESSFSNNIGLRFFTRTGTPAERMRISATGNVGIGTTSPNVILDIDGTDAIRLPVGNTNARPSTTDEATHGGYVRYNNGTHQFEGYGPGDSWGSLGGVINVAQNTKIIAESFPAATNNQLQFFTAPKVGSLNSANNHFKSRINTLTESINSGVYILPITGGSGSGASVQINAGANSIDHFTVRTGYTGSGYIKGDVLTITAADLSASGRTTDIVFTLTTHGDDNTFGGDDIIVDGDGTMAERMIVDTTGYVGIGTTTPVTKLDVIGNIRTGDTNAGTHIELSSGDLNGFKIAYIDFSCIHSDYDGRIICQETTGALGSGTMQYEGSLHTFIGGDIRIIPLNADNDTESKTSNIQLWATFDQTNNLNIDDGAPRRAADITCGYADTDNGVSGQGAWGNEYLSFGVGNPILNPTGVTFEPPDDPDPNLKTERMRITTIGVGIGTNSPNVILDISGTDALRLPVGTVLQRPIAAGVTDTTTIDKYIGSIRYNSDNSQFEGYGPGNAWGSLGGVINVAQNTKIIASWPNADSKNNDLMFFTAPTDNITKEDAAERMRINASGNVGIGTTAPAHKLHVVGDTRLEGKTYIGAGPSWTDEAYIQFIRPTTSDVSNNTHLDDGFHTDKGDLSEISELQFVTTDNDNSDPTVGGDDIGFYPAGEVNCSKKLNALSFNATSDIRHKENIVELENSLEKITSLRAVNYNFKETPNSKAAGLIAQEVDKIIPEAISKRKADKWTLDYNSITGYLVGCIKELKEENDKLHDDVSAIKEMLNIK